MHPSLHLANVSKLPLKLSTFANAVARGDSTATSNLLDALIGGDIAREHSILFLPALYCALDPSRTTAILSALDTANSDTEISRIRIQLGVIFMTIRALATIFDVVPTAAYQNLWPCLWQWIRFSDTYREHLPGDNILSGAAAYHVYATIFRFLNQSRAMDTSIGIHVVIGRAWTHLIHAEAASFDDLCDAIACALPKPTRAQLDDLILGVGGGEDDLIPLVITHFYRLLPSPDVVLNSTRLFHLTPICVLLEEYSDVANRKEFLSQGIVTPFVNALRALSRVPTHKASLLLHRFWKLLVNYYFASMPCPPHIVDALHAGLLPALLSSGPIKTVKLTILTLVAEILPRAAVYHSVLTQLRLSLLEVNDSAIAFSTPELLKSWGSFVELAETRFSIIDKYIAEWSKATRACDNLDCGKFWDKLELKRCGGCLTTYYCSDLCQRQDWGARQHSSACKTLASDRIQLRLYINAKDRSFLRFLLHHDYTAHREELALHLILLMRAHPGDSLYFDFNYTLGACRMAIRRAAESPPSQLSYDMMHAGDSGGRMRTHLMLVGEEAPYARLWRSTKACSGSQRAFHRRQLSKNSPLSGRGFRNCSRWRRRLTSRVIR
ncbi:hypothetical protein C8R46DRAFT_1192628 [Mycena filopes]|nr:hypothetical protein C8R46DRAFT_1192628 [Mycena filopes]